MTAPSRTRAHVIRWRSKLRWRCTCGQSGIADATAETHAYETRGRIEMGQR